MGLDVDFASLHNLVNSDGRPNFAGLRIPVPTGLHIRAWEKHLWDYEDKEIIEFLNFGWPITYSKELPPSSYYRNHPSVVDTQKQFMILFTPKSLKVELLVFFYIITLIQSLLFSPLMTVAKWGSDKRQVVHDLSFPPEKSVNLGNDSDNYLGQPYTL